ncbi:histone-lysine N-methyltransferase SETMAR [Trichonephila clavipes]|nr:histone-lysine N-methyltransferase SETMAR [Trichonephila clavipes]
MVILLWCVMTEARRCIEERRKGEAAWIKVETKAILTIYHHIITRNYRISLSHSDNRNFILQIRNVQESDKGGYMCQVNTVPMKSQVGYLDVLVPPDILEEGSSSDVIVREGANVTLTCKAVGYPTPNITWRREDNEPIPLGAWQGKKFTETKFRFYLYPLQRSDRSSSHARQTLSIKEKKHTCVIFRSLSATYALLCLFTMSVLIENSAACEIRCVIRFLNAKKVKPIEIYWRICEVYGQNAMSDSMVRRWVRHFNEGRSEVYDDERSGRPSLITEELVHTIDEKIKENRKLTISALAMEFPQISRSLMHEIVTDKLKFHKLCARWVPKILTESHKTKRMGCALEFLTRYHEGGVDFLSQIVTGDETCVSFDTPESKQ